MFVRLFVLTDIYTCKDIRLGFAINTDTLLIHHKEKKPKKKKKKTKKKKKEKDKEKKQKKTRRLNQKKPREEKKAVVRVRLFCRIHPFFSSTLAFYGSITLGAVTTRSIIISSNSRQ